MTILEKNLEALPGTDRIYEQAKENRYVLEKARSGAYTTKIDTIYVHSKYDPEKEARRIADFLLADKKELDIIIIFGGGLGYVVESIYNLVLKDNTSAIRPYLLYIEADINIFLSSLEVFDWSPMAADDHFKIFLEADKEQIGSFIQSVPTKKLRYYYHRPTYTAGQDYYKDIQNYISYVLNRKDMNIATFTRFQELWTKNYILNIPYILRAQGINKLKGAGPSTTSLIIAGGPTLESSMGYIKKMQDKAVVIAVDTVYKYLKKHDIHPDIIVTIDPQFWNYKYLENESIENSIIVTDSFAYEKIFQLTPPENCFIGNSLFPIGKYFVKEERGSMAAGGSVATTAFDTARIIGSTEIVLLGLDLGFPGKMTHFKGAFFETRFLTFSGYFATAEEQAFRYLNHTDSSKAPATKGGLVQTDTKMLIFKKWFDREIPVTGAKVFQPDLGGVKLEGTKIVDLETLPDVPADGSKKHFLETIGKIVNNKKGEQPDDVTQKIAGFIKKTGEVKKICVKLDGLIAEDGTVSPDTGRKVTLLEQELFESGERSEVASIISASAQDVILSIMENVEYDGEDKKSAWKKSKMLYAKVAQLCDFYTRFFHKLLHILPVLPYLKKNGKM